jgi:hypothetical protein
MYKVTLTDAEMLLVLNALELKTECTSENKAREYRALFDRLENVFEDRVQS